MNRSKITKTKYSEITRSKASYNTGNAYDLNESGGFKADRKIKEGKKLTTDMKKSRARTPRWPKNTPI